MNKWLILILLASLAVRLYRLDNLTLFGDEIDVGNQAYSLLTTARDYRGNFLPTYIHSFSESRAPLFLYSAIPTVAIFGRTELGVRLPAIIFGILSIYLFYRLVLILTQSSPTSLVSASLLAISPWHFHYSRSAFEVTLLLSLLLLATILFLRSRFFSSFILFSLSLYTYNTANIFTPLLLIFLLAYRHWPFKKLFFPVLGSFIILLPLLAQLFFGQAGSRFQLISIFADRQLIDAIVTRRTSFSSTSPTTERFFHNKATAYTQSFFSNYFRSLSPSYIFIDGDPNPRHNIPFFGLLPLIFIPFLVFGFILHYRHQPLFTFWLLASPIASSLTQGGGQHATRLFLLLPPLIYFTATGLIKANFKISALVTLILCFNIATYFHQYFVHFPADTFESWGYGLKYLYSTPLPPHQRVFVSNLNFDSLNPYLFYQQQSSRLTQGSTFTDQSQPNIINDFSGFRLNSETFFIDNWQSVDIINRISQVAQTGDVFFLLQLKDIPGDWDFTKNPLPGFTTLKTAYLPNHQIYGQVIKKL